MQSQDFTENICMVSTLKVWFELQEVQTGLSIFSIHTMFLSVYAFFKNL